MVADLFPYKWASYRRFTAAKIVHLIAEIVPIQKIDPYIVPKKFNMFVTCHILLCRNMSHYEKIDFFAWKAVWLFSNTASFLKLEKNPHMRSEKIVWFFSKLKNKAAFEKKSHHLFFWHVLFSQSRSSSNIFFRYIFKETHRLSTISEQLLTWSFDEYICKFQKSHFLLHFALSSK